MLPNSARVCLFLRNELLFPWDAFIKKRSILYKIHSSSLGKTTNGDSLILYFKWSLICEILLTLALWKRRRKKWFCLPCCLLLEVEPLPYFRDEETKADRSHLSLPTEIRSQSLPLIYQLWKQLSNPIPFSAMLLRSDSAAKASQWTLRFSKNTGHASMGIKVQKYRYHPSKT